MSYNDIINWPKVLDKDFPTLRDNESSIVSDNEKFYAAHFNKIRNFLVKAYAIVSSTNTAFGDGTFQKMSMPHTFQVSLQDLLKVGAFDVVLNSAKVPGNCLPFEFIITKSTDNYVALVTKTTSLFLEQKTSIKLNKSFGGINPFNKHISTAQIVGASSASFDNTKINPSNYRVVCSSIIGSDTILMRGFIVDMQLSASNSTNGDGSNLWKTLSPLSPALKVSFIAFE